MRRLFAAPLLLLACERSPSGQPSPGASTSAATAAASSAPASSASSAAPLSPKAVKFLEDLNAFCVATQEVKADKSIPDDRKAAEIVGRLVASNPGPEFLKTLRGLADKPSGELRYQALKQAAAERGATHWSCPAMAD